MQPYSCGTSQLFNNSTIQKDLRVESKYEGMERVLCCISDANIRLNPTYSDESHCCAGLLRSRFDDFQQTNGFDKTFFVVALVEVSHGNAPA